VHRFEPRNEDAGRGLTGRVEGGDRLHQSVGQELLGITDLGQKGVVRRAPK
jgi:hypothetical protein